MTVTTDAKHVSRRRFLKGSAVAAGTVAAGTVAMPNVSRAETITLKMQSSWGASDVFHEMAKQYTDRCTAMAGNRLKFDLLPAGAVVKAFQVQDACSDGVIDAAHSVSAYWYGKHKAASLFGTGPVFGCDATQMLAWIQSKDGRELYRELTQDVLGLDIVGFFAMPMPTQPLGWFRKEIKTAADMNGVKYRTVGLAADVMQGMGLAVTQLPGGEIVPALERGVIDAFEFNNPTSDRQFGAQNVSKNYMLGSYHQASEFFEILFSKKKFDSLPEEVKAILEYGAEAANTANYALAVDRYSADLQGLMKEDGVTVSRTPQAVMKAQLESWDKVLEKLEQDAFFKKVVDSQRKWAERVGFYFLMNQADYEMAYNHHFPDKLKKA